MSDSMVSFPGLGFDPAPGSPASVARLAESMTAAQRQLTEALHIITSVGHGGTWTGDAANAFLSRVGELPKHLQRAEDSFGSAAHVLTGWQSQLASMQRQAVTLESEAVTARARLQGAEMNPVLGYLGHTFPDPQQQQQAQQQYDAAVQEINTAQHDLDALLAQAGRLLAEHHGLAAEAARAIDAAAHLAPDSPGLFASLLGDLESVIQGNIQMAESALKWVKDHANAINAVGDMLSTASTVVSLASTALDLTGYGAVLGVPLDGIASALSAGALGAHLVAKAAGAPVSDRTLAEDGLGFVTVGVGKTLIRAKAVEGALNDAVNLSMTTNSVVDLVGDPSSLQYFVPRNRRQGAEEVGLQGGGALLVGFENAWNAGSAKDRAAHGG